MESLLESIELLEKQMDIFLNNLLQLKTELKLKKDKSNRINYEIDYTYKGYDTHEILTLQDEEDIKALRFELELINQDISNLNKKINTINKDLSELICARSEILDLIGYIDETSLQSNEKSK